MNQPFPQPVPVVAPTPEEAYNALPYHYDQYHDYPEGVVRIPVAGPAPYNTLVYFRWRAAISTYAWANGHTYHHDFLCPTPLVIAQYDPNDPVHSAITHSSTGSLSMMQITPEAEVLADDNTDFTAAIEMVLGDAQVDGTGRVSISVSSSDRAFQVFYCAMAYVSTWALIYEPRVRAGAWDIPVREALRRNRAMPLP